MSVPRRSILIWVLLFAVELGLPAATAPENRAFEAAAQKLTAGFYQQAEADFAEFCQKFPNSPLLPEAVLYQAEARIKLTNSTGALELLTAHQSQAGKRTDEYLFWQAEALSQKGDLQTAAERFGALARDFPDSPRRLEATVREATARARLSEWPRVLEILRQTNGVFQAATRANVTNEMVARGYLLLSEAYLRNGEHSLAEATLQPLVDRPLNAQLNWQRQFLLCRVLAATARTEPALQATTNLLAIAAAAGQPEFQADSFALYAELLERSQRLPEALAAYQRNLGCGAPPERQRQSVVKITEISLAQNRIPDATQALQKFIEQCPGAPCGDLALLTLGELHLRQHQAALTNVAVVVVSTNVPALTNRVQQALADFQTFTNKFPQSPLVGKVLLDIGWCFWLENRMAESQSVLQSAVLRLPLSTDLALAWFKLGDAQFSQTNFAAAVTSYSAVVDKFAAFPEVTNTLFEPALYEIVRAGLAANDWPVVTNALDKILAWFPHGSYTDGAALLAGQEVGQRDPAAARKLFSGIGTRSPNSPLLPYVQLAIARTYELEDHWTEAIDQYTRWLEVFTNHPGQARAEYSRARACSQANLQTNAFNYFTNFLARFPETEFAPLAQWWLAGYYYRVLGDLKAAEQNYQVIYQNTNWPVTELTFHARMMAGRVAFDRAGWNDARDYFSKLVNNTNCPPAFRAQEWAAFRAQAWIAFGDTLVSQDSTNKAADYSQALTAYDQVFSLCPSNQMAALAWGQKASCLLQCARSSEDYTAVSNAFLQVIESPQADAKARSIATVGIGATLEKMALLRVGAEQTALFNLALGSYLDVFYGKMLRPTEKPDLFWTREAGMKAGRLAESMKMYRQAANVYQRLQDLFPPLRLEGRINNLKALEQESAARR
ncbi:MAG TPA: tetratricopeptide repeat protein [Verrucomicrobiae bacterium]